MPVATTLPPPHNEQELLQRAHALAGLSFAELAQRQQQVLPTTLRHAKGWLGQQLEHCLGADAGNQAQPDFVHLGVELKTLPIRGDRIPKETTYVCTVPLQYQGTMEWQHSWVRRKLQRVLWFPFEADPQIPVAQRRLGSAIIWSPSVEDEHILRRDWEEMMELISTGRINEISAHLGTYLQVRPKAANHRALTPTTDIDGERSVTLPRGFYLRTQFTAKILRRHYA